MIREAYCSYEVSKKLKELGFNELCVKVHLDAIIPTHQMAMAWLRKEYEEHICIHPVDIINEKQTFGWIFEIYDSKIGLQLFQSPERFSTYEEAVEAAIEHCLNIIEKANERTHTD